MIRGRCGCRTPWRSTRPLSPQKGRGVILWGHSWGEGRGRRLRRDVARHVDLLRSRGAQ